MASYISIALHAVLFVCLAASTSATVYTVGDSAGWTTGTDYSSWTSGKTFASGDSLVFNYAPSAHTVNEVTASDYSACSTSNYITTDNSGSTTVPLTTAGTHYFVCGVPGHCAGGMKLSVSVSSGSGNSTPSTTPPSTSTPSMTPPSTTTPGGTYSYGAAGALMTPALGLAVGAVVIVAKLGALA